jgi:hypothetical protein
VYPHLRLATCASLIAFTGIVGIGAPLMLSRAVERPLVVSAEAPYPTALPPRTPLVAEREVVERSASTAGTFEAPPAAETAPAKRSAETRRTATVTVEPLPQNELTAPEHAIPMQPSAAEAAAEKPAAETLHTATATAEPVPQNELTPQTTPMQPPAAGGAHVARAASKTKARLPALKKTARLDRVAKRRTKEALNSVRRFGDTLHDIPADAYASEGTRRRIVIRPTSIQDVYYYSVPR